MKPFDIWVLTLLTLFIVGLLGVIITGDARWWFLVVLPGAVFAKWMRVG